MEFIPFFLVLVILAVLVLPIAAIVTANSRASALRREMGYLEERLRGIEAQLQRLERQAETSAGLAAAQETTAEPTAGAAAVRSGTAQAELRGTPEQTPVTPEPVMQQAVTAIPATAAKPVFQAPVAISAPIQTPVAATTPQFRTLQEVGRSNAGGGDTQSLESRIGSQWFNRVGILAVLIGVAWFLKLAFDNHWIGPRGRVMIGLLAGAGLIAWSERFHKRGFAIFSYSLKAIGSGTLYLSLWAAFQLYALMPAGAAFASMIAVTAFNGYMAWTQDAELLALYAIAGGLSTPLLVSTGGNHEVTLFTYLLMLDLAVLALTALKPWSRLLFVAFTGTVVFVCGWWQVYYSTDQATTTALFVCCFFLPFALAPRLIRIAADGIAPCDITQSGSASFQGSSFQGWNGLVLFLLPVANAALGFLAFYAMLSLAGNEWAPPWLAVGFAAFYLLLMRLPEGGVVRGGAGALAALHLTIAIVFLTMAIPLKTHGRWLTIGWLVEGAVLMWLSRRLKSTLLRTFALISMILGLGALVTVNPPAANTPIFNERFGTYCVAIAVCGFIAWLARTAHDEQEPEGAMNWPVLAAAAVLAVNVLILIAVTLEIHAYWWAREIRGSMRYGFTGDFWMYTQFSYSAFFMLFGGALLTIGFLKRTAFLRWQALILLAVTVAKVFLVDMSELGSGLRIVSFIGLGVLLLCVSYVYQRDWLNLRGQKENQR
jgi:uncharacterized membrane protein